MEPASLSLGDELATLPTEILLHILDHLDVCDLLAAARVGVFPCNFPGLGI